MSGILEAAKEVGRKVAVGAALTAAASPFFPLPATAQQQMATNVPRTTASAPAPDFSACDAMSQTNPKGAITCRVKVLDASGAAARQEGAAARQQGASAQSRLDCLDRALILLNQGKIPEAKAQRAQCG